MHFLLQKIHHVSRDTVPLIDQNDILAGEDFYGEDISHTGLGAYTGYTVLLLLVDGRALWFSGFQASMNITNTWHRQRGGGECLEHDIYVRLPIYGSGDFTVLNKDKTKLQTVNSIQWSLHFSQAGLHEYGSLGLIFFSQKLTTCSLLINRC